MVKQIPKIISFLGYEPEITSILSLWGKTILGYRMSNGITQKKLANMIDIDERTLSKVEREEGWFFEKNKKKIEFFLNTISH